MLPADQGTSGPGRPAGQAPQNPPLEVAPPLPADALQDLLDALRLWHFDRAQGLLDRLLAQAVSPQRDILNALRLTLRWQPSVTSAGRSEDLQAAVEALRGIEFAEAGECSPLRDWMFSVVGVRLGTMGAVETSLRWLDRAIQGSRQRGDVVQWRRALSNKSGVLLLAGALEQAQALNEEALALLPESDPDRPTLLNNHASACILGARRLPPESAAQRQAMGEQALALTREALSLADPPRYPWYPGWILANIGHAQRLLGRLDEARQTYEHALPLCEGSPRALGDLMVNLAALLADTGQPDQAEAWLGRAEPLLAPGPMAPAYDLLLETQLRLQTMTGRHEQALQWSERRWRRMQDRYQMRLQHALADELQGELERARRAEQEAQLRAQALDAASSAKSAFVAHMSHEIRTPIHAILGLAQLLRDEPLAASQAEKVDGILEAGESLLNIVNDILDLSKIDAGQMPLDSEPMAVPALLRRVERMLRPGALAKGLSLQVNADALPAIELLGDAARIEQMLVNLVGNAIKFTPRGQVVVEAALQPASEGVHRLRVEVRDTGVGISAEAMQQLFTPFVQADSRITRKYGGTGLGLAISRRLADLMGGHLGATSKPGQGSTFWFELPLQPVPADTEPAPLDEAPLPRADRRGPRLRGLRVLAADDNRLNRLVIQRQLQREGAQVQLAEDGQQVLQALRAQPTAFDVVLMDLQMPVMDGLSATRALRAEPALAQMPVIALSAGVLAQDHDAALSAGMNRFVAKPIDLERLVEVLRPYMKTPQAPGDTGSIIG